MNKLTDEEKRIIEDKGTETPFSGEYWNNHETGMYSCKKCGQALFSSETKFDSNTGWPSFDAALPGAVKEVTDADGMRTEIVCSQCDAHLGHKFEGEGFTEKNVRHCVNSVCLHFQSSGDGSQKPDRSK